MDVGYRAISDIHSLFCNSLFGNKVLFWYSLHWLLWHKNFVKIMVLFLLSNFAHNWKKHHLFVTSHCVLNVIFLSKTLNVNKKWHEACLHYKELKALYLASNLTTGIHVRLTIFNSFYRKVSLKNGNKTLLKSGPCPL